MPKYTKARVDKICRLIEEDDYTVSELCKLTGIVESTYFEWKASKPEFSEAITQAEDKRLQTFKVLARKGLRILLEGKEWEETTTEGKLIKDGDKEVFKTTKAKKIKKFILPNPTSVLFALKNLDGDNFKDIIRTDLTSDGEPIKRANIQLPDGTTLEI